MVVECQKWEAAVKDFRAFSGIGAAWLPLRSGAFLSRFGSRSSMEGKPGDDERMTRDSACIVSIAEENSRRDAMVRNVEKPTMRLAHQQRREDDRFEKLWQRDT
jgi:hypothetical protein